jgi:Amt family ammonium transporter
VAALAGGICLGPRLGKYKADGTPNALPGHHIPMAVAGCFILAFGWFGFNAGSSLAGTDLRIGVIATNTMLASAAGAMSSMLYHVELLRQARHLHVANGRLAVWSPSPGRAPLSSYSVAASSSAPLPACCCA